MKFKGRYLFLFLNISLTQSVMRVLFQFFSKYEKEVIFSSNAVLIMICT